LNENSVSGNLFLATWWTSGVKTRCHRFISVAN